MGALLRDNTGVRGNDEGKMQREIVERARFFLCEASLEEDYNLPRMQIHSTSSLLDYPKGTCQFHSRGIVREIHAVSWEKRKEACGEGHAF